MENEERSKKIKDLYNASITFSEVVSSLAVKEYSTGLVGKPYNDLRKLFVNFPNFYKEVYSYSDYFEILDFIEDFIDEGLRPVRIKKILDRMKKLNYETNNEMDEARKKLKEIYIPSEYFLLL